jgi:hypothetical protein
VPRGGQAQLSVLVSANAGAAELVFLRIRLETYGLTRPRHGKGNAPRRLTPKRARDIGSRRNSERCAPTSRGSKPLKRGRSGSNALCAESATYQRSRRERPSGRSDEHVFVTASPGEVRGESRPSVCPLRSVANRRRGCLIERLRRSLLGKALKGIAPRARLVGRTPGSPLREQGVEAHGKCGDAT